MLADGGQPLENANAVITELNLSVGTNAQGRYAITVPAERVRGQTVTVRIRAISYLAATREVVLTAGTHTVDVTLKRDINRLEEVVVTGVTGATEQQKNDLRGHVAQLRARPRREAGERAGVDRRKVPGATVVGGNGRPGTAPSIVLRGAKSINASGRDQGPLIIVDGILLNGNSTDINPEDIESIEVVKGAAGASIYGSRAAERRHLDQDEARRRRRAGLRIDARQEAGADDIQGSYPFPTRTIMMLDETGTRYCVKNSAFPSCSRTIDWDTEVLRINSVQNPTVAASNTIERDYGLSSNPTKTELKGLFEVNQWPKMYNPVDRIKTNEPHLTRPSI